MGGMSGCAVPLSAQGDYSVLSDTESLATGKSSGNVRHPLAQHEDRGCKCADREAGSIFVAKALRP